METLQISLAQHITHQRQMDTTLEIQNMSKMERQKMDCRCTLHLEQMQEMQLPAQGTAAHIRLTTTQYLITLQRAGITRPAGILKRSTTVQLAETHTPEHARLQRVRQTTARQTLRHAATLHALGKLQYARLVERLGFSQRLPAHAHRLGETKMPAQVS